MARKLKGIRRHGNRWEVYINVEGVRYYATADDGKRGFPLETDLDVLRTWQDTERARRKGTSLAPGSSFAGDIAADGRATAAWPTAGQRAAHLALWLRALGADRPSDSITSGEIEAILERWRTTPTVRIAGQLGRPSDPHGLKPGTIRKRRTTLQSFFSRKNGKRGHNPVRGTTAPELGDTEDRSIDYAAIERALGAMTTHRSVKRGELAPVSRSAVIARVLAYTGIPPALLKAITPHDLTLAGPAPAVRVPYRLKGKIAPRRLPLTAPALAAFRAFHAVDAYGPFTTQTVNLCFQKGCRAVGLDTRIVTLYALRHSFLTELYKATRDQATVARFAMHAPGSRVTARYTRGAHADVDRAAAAALSAAFHAAAQGALKEAAPVHERYRNVATKRGKVAI